MRANQEYKLYMNVIENGKMVEVEYHAEDQSSRSSSPALPSGSASIASTDVSAASSRSPTPDDEFTFLSLGKKQRKEQRKAQVLSNQKYQEGQSLEKDGQFHKAIYCYSDSAQHYQPGGPCRATARLWELGESHALAHVELGKCYEHGWGEMPRDILEAACAYSHAVIMAKGEQAKEIAEYADSLLTQVLSSEEYNSAQDEENFLPCASSQVPDDSKLETLGLVDLIAPADSELVQHGLLEVQDKTSLFTQENPASSQAGALKNLGLFAFADAVESHPELEKHGLLAEDVSSLFGTTPAK